MILFPRVQQDRTAEKLVGRADPKMPLAKTEEVHNAGTGPTMRLKNPYSRSIVRVCLPYTSRDTLCEYTYANILGPRRYAALVFRPKYRRPCHFDSMFILLARNQMSLPRARLSSYFAYKCKRDRHQNINFATKSGLFLPRPSTNIFSSKKRTRIFL